MAIVVNGAPAALSDAHVFVLSIPLTSPVSLGTQIPPAASAVWLHNGEGMVCVGEVVRITASGNSRFNTLASAFTTVADQASVTDVAHLRGSGLTAFASFSYADSSPRDSVLVIPRLILGTSHTGAFLTLIDTTPIDQPDPETLARLLSQFESAPTPSFTLRGMQGAHSPESYRGLVKEAVQRIDDGEAHKIVLSERFHVELGAGQPHELVPGIAQALHNRYPTAWTFAFADIVGASPEMLARTQQNRLFSRVLAGSRPVAEGDHLSIEDREAFLNDPKELAEHSFAADSVKEPLTELGITLSESHGPYVLELPGLEHLASDMHGIMPPHLGIVDVIERLHPSAAVSGTPREAADAHIAELEGTDRGGYASPVGWFNSSGDGEFAIALRMAHILDNELVVQAGGGIVSASDPLTEHAEALAKTRPIMRALDELVHDEAAPRAFGSATD